MAQKQRQNSSQNAKHDQSGHASQWSYERQLQDPSYEQRQMEVEVCIAEADGLDDSEPESPDDNGDADNDSEMLYDSEMPYEDEDAVKEESRDVESRQASGDCRAESAFASEGDAIYVLPSERKCVVEEDLSKWAYYHSSNKVFKSNKFFKEPSRMTCYRAIAKWLEDEFKDSLRNPADLMKNLKPVTQEAFCKKYKLLASALSKAIKDSYLVWPDSELPLGKLFNFNKEVV